MSTVPAPAPTLSKDELLSSLESHNRSLAEVEDRRDKIMNSRRLTMLDLHVSHGLSFRELGRLCGLSAPAIQQNLRAVGLEKQGAKSDT